MNDLQKYFSKSLLATAALIVGVSPAWAQAPALGAASAFSVLGGTAVTCTDSVILTGAVGVSPGTAFTNTSCVITGGMPPATNTAAVAARAAFVSAYADLRSRACTQTVPGNLTDQNLAPGVYCLDSVAKAGTLTLTGPADGVWIFLVDGSLTGTDFKVVMAGGGQPCNVYWAPSAAVTFTTSAVKGNILAGDLANDIVQDGSITLSGGTLAGRALASLAVTMTNASLIGCDAAAGGPLVCKAKDRDEDRKHHKGHKKGQDDDKDHGNGHDGDDDNNGHGSDTHNPFQSKDKK